MQDKDDMMPEMETPDPEGEDHQRASNDSNTRDFFKGVLQSLAATGFVAAMLWFFNITETKEGFGLTIVFLVATFVFFIGLRYIIKSRYGWKIITVFGTLYLILVGVVVFYYVMTIETPHEIRYSFEGNAV